MREPTPNDPHRERSIHQATARDLSEASDKISDHRAEGVVEYHYAAFHVHHEADDEVVSLATLSSYIERTCKAAALDLLFNDEESTGVSLSVRKLSSLRPGDPITVRAHFMRDPAGSMIHLHVTVFSGTRLTAIADHCRLVAERGLLKDRQNARDELAI